MIIKLLTAISHASSSLLRLLNMIAVNRQILTHDISNKKPYNKSV